MTRRGGRRVWMLEHTEQARALLHDFRRDMTALSAAAPLGSPEYDAISKVMKTTAEALEAFGVPVFIAPARK